MARTRRPSLRDVATLAGVSPGTASRVLSGSDYPVSADVRWRVERASATLGYVANSAARALVTGRSAVIGAVVHDITDPYFGEVVRGLEDAATGDLRAVLVASDDRDPRKLIDRVRMLLQHGAAGLVLVGGQVIGEPDSTEVDRELKTHRDRGFPIVAVGRYCADIPYVSANELGAARLAVNHLLGLGHRRIAFLGGPRRSTTVRDRQAGFVQALDEAGVDVDQSLLLDAALSREGGAEGVQSLIAAGHAFTAMVAATDEVAFGAIAGLRAVGRSVPGDVSVVGFNGVGMCEFVNPPLTSLRLPMREFGSIAVRLIAAMQNGHDVPSQTTLDVDLVVRGSTGPARGRVGTRRDGRAQVPVRLGSRGPRAFQKALPGPAARTSGERPDGR